MRHMFPLLDKDFPLRFCYGQLWDVKVKAIKEKGKLREILYEEIS